MAMMAITTSSSISVKPRRTDGFFMRKALVWTRNDGVYPHGLALSGWSVSLIGRWPLAPTNSEEEDDQSAVRALGGLGGALIRFLSRQGGRTSVRGRCEEMGLDDSCSGERFPAGKDEDFNLGPDWHAWR